ncbi:sensor histidine kinase [Martelella soudanensis]|uniref:sensor histidine kinase n=1 Tax=unclassified Martelella TaxID=2629616 RepID=UPI0015DD6B9D|nr:MULTISPECIES: sensor histidine kinase [unclassified Martelella]
MKKSLSLRTRLFLLILVPLLCVSCLLGLWRFEAAKRTAEELFDRTLLAAGLAIARDVAISEGDAISQRSRSIISDAGGGEIFYHVTGPGGIYVTGYAYPPVPETKPSDEGPTYYMANYRGEPVRVLRMSETTTIGNLTGETVVTIWQRASDRRAFAITLALRAAALMAALMVALAVVVWFGVQIGLKPLRGLQEAIALRSPEDLRRIRRPVPEEVSGIVATLNRLLGQVEQSIENHQAFISDAAHQLRNPASALLSLAEALRDARTEEDRAQLQSELVMAARKSARLAEQLLSLERLRYDAPAQMNPRDLNVIVKEACEAVAPEILSRDLAFSLDAAPGALVVQADETLLSEAVKNLVDNALQHGGARLSAITVQTEREGANAVLKVMDDGKGLPPELADIAFRRFGQIEPGSGSGLGLAIVQDVVLRHGGTIGIMPNAKGTEVRITLPFSER